jgi:hypothetical protein
MIIHVTEAQTTQWPKEKVQTNKQQSTKHTHKTKDRFPYQILGSDRVMVFNVTFNNISAMSLRSDISYLRQ